MRMIKYTGLVLLGNLVVGCLLQNNLRVVTYPESGESVLVGPITSRIENDCPGCAAVFREQLAMSLIENGLMVRDLSRGQQVQFKQKEKKESQKEMPDPAGGLLPEKFKNYAGESSGLAGGHNRPLTLLASDDIARANAALRTDWYLQGSIYRIVTGSFLAGRQNAFLFMRLYNRSGQLICVMSSKLNDPNSWPEDLARAASMMSGKVDLMIQRAPVADKKPGLKAEEKI